MRQIRVSTKHGPGVHGPLLWTESMDHFHGPGPWTHVMDRVHGHFFLNNEKLTTTEIVQK